MAFRKRNVGIGRQPASPASLTVADAPTKIEQLPGVRPSPLTSHPVTSTGAPSIDGLLGGHSGLALGSSLLIGEHETTDFAGALLRYYAAEGILQGHVVHVVGVGEGWVRELPGLADSKYQQKPDQEKSADGVTTDKMKIAWRYERLGQAGERALPDRSISSNPQDPMKQELPFYHTFDLTKRLTLPSDAKINHIPLPRSGPPLQPILASLSNALSQSPPSAVHRLVIPTILSPALYPPQSAKPENFIRFIHGLRTLLRQYPSQLTVMATLPLTLYPRGSAVTRWAETLSDGVLELTPFPHLMDATHPSHYATTTSAKEEQPQGMVKVHKLPLVTERGEGGAGAGNSIGEDLAFTLSRRKFLVAPFSLPPMEGDQDAQAEAGKVTAKDVEF
ncbi:hypothetical protein WHR41_03751 [Cladosporium halotolerans]|uniref:Elongator complex protein 4 n=1 Tax=Cladosporium halotolerans TaxID=1052096 RepID=A0AB34KU41_9PEZI